MSSPMKPRKRKVGKFEYDETGIRRNSKERLNNYAYPRRELGERKGKIRSPGKEETLKKLSEK